MPENRRRLSVLEWITVTHVGVLVVWTTWAFGGGAEWMRLYFTWWGALGVLITLTALQDRTRAKDGGLRPLRWLWPLAAFNAFVVAGTFNPSLREINFGGETVLAHTGAKAWLPSSARPQLAWPALLLFDALWISAFNVALVLRRRRAIRGLLLVLAANALALAVFGTAQKLGHATGIYFGQFPTRQPYFFSTFVYHNHWGAFILLMLAAVIGLTWHYARRIEARNVFHSPAFGGVIALFFLAASIPLSGSRSCTLFMGALLLAALGHWTARVARQRRRLKESIVPPLAGAAVALILGLAGIWFVARDTIQQRAVLTRDQVATMLAQGSIGARSELYGNTWRMAQDNPWFGWGMASYPHVFSRFYNTQTSIDRLPVFYRDAHNDWLQALAEHGFLGSALLALCAIVPLLGVRGHALTSPISAYLLGGCALLLLYAWLEFPFGNVSVVLTWWTLFFCALAYARLNDREFSAGPSLSSSAA